MDTFVALLRAVNVGGTGKLPMADLRALCERQGFEAVRTYIASGNVVFRSALSEAEISSSLEDALKAYAGKRIGVIVRTGAEMAAVLAANPFPAAAPNRTVAIFLNAPPPSDWRDGVASLDSEALATGVREIYVRYGAGMASSKLRIAAAAEGAARNLNTVAKLTELAAV